MKNTMTDLNNYLFEQLERLNDDSMGDEQIEKEIKRSKAVTGVAHTIIENGHLALAVKKHMEEYGQGEQVELPMVSKEKKQQEKIGTKSK